jgi:simple sugar transport system ATP-binding protein
LAFVPEDRHLEGLWMQESTEQNLALGHEDRYAPRGLINRSLRRELATLAGPQLDVRAPSLDTAVEKLSGGNQQKVVIARETVGRNVRLLIAHQPTRGVDIGATDLIHRAILQNVDQRGMAALILSSELDELMALCDRIVVLHQGRSVKIFDRGHFDRLAIGAAMAGGRPA